MADLLAAAPAVLGPCQVLSARHHRVRARVESNARLRPRGHNADDRPDTRFQQAEGLGGDQVNDSLGGLLLSRESDSRVATLLLFAQSRSDRGQVAPRDTGPALRTSAPCERTPTTSSRTKLRSGASSERTHGRPSSPTRKLVSWPRTTRFCSRTTARSCRSLPTSAGPTRRCMSSAITSSLSSSRDPMATSRRAGTALTLRSRPGTSSSLTCQACPSCSIRRRTSRS